MAFTVSWITPRRYRSPPPPLNIVVKLLIAMISLSSLSSPVGSVSIKCGACEESRCPELHYCEGEPVKDHCGCCTVCSSSRFQPHPLIMGSSEREGSACAQVKCPKFKVCMENVQSLPLCTCPSAFICRTRKRERAVCGTDGSTYKSRCYLRIAACNAGARIKVARKGPCNGDAEAPLPDGSRPPRVCESFSTCRRRKNQRPVCGSDDKTYMSRCQMKIQACQLGLKIRLKNRGVCHTPSAHNTHTNARGPHGGGGGGNTHNNGRPHGGGGGNTRPHHNPRPRPPGARINTHRVSDRSDGVMNGGGGGGGGGSMSRLTRNDGTHQGDDGGSDGGLRGRGGKGRRGKKKGSGSGSDVDNMDEEKRKRRQRKREKRLKRKERRRKRRKTRGKSRSRRNKIDRRKQRLPPRRTFDDNMHWDF